MNLVVQGQKVETRALKDLATLTGSEGIGRLGNNAFRLIDAKPHPDLAAYCDAHQLDFAFVPEDRHLNNFRLFVTDMDSTLISIECIDEIAIVIAEPQQHNVNDLIGVFVEQFRAGGSHDSRSQRLVAVIVIAQFLDQLAVFNTGQGIPAHQFLRYVFATTGQPRGCSSSD